MTRTITLESPDGWRHQIRRWWGCSVHQFWPPKPGQLVRVECKPHNGWSLVKRGRWEIYVENVSLQTILQAVPEELHDRVRRVHLQLVDDIGNLVLAWESRRERFARELATEIRSEKQ